MRHGNKVNHLGRTYSHRKALLANLANSLIINKRIVTTLAKAKELRVFVEPLITKSKDNATHARRTVFSNLKSKEAAKELFDIVAPKIADRPGGYTRIIKTGNRTGDNAEMAYIELVDFNDVYVKDGAASASKSKRTRRASKKAKETAAPAAETASNETESESAE